MTRDPVLQIGKSMTDFRYEHYAWMLEREGCLDFDAASFDRCHGRRNKSDGFLMCCNTWAAARTKQTDSADKGT